MVATRAARRRNHNDDEMNSSNNAHPAAAASAPECIDLTLSDSDDDEVQIVAPPPAKRQRKNKDAEIGGTTRRGRALKPVNDNRQHSNTVAQTSHRPTTRTTRGNSIASKTAAVVSENPSTKRAKVTRTASTTTQNATANHQRRRATSRTSNPYALRQKKSVPIKTPATTESIGSGNDATTTDKPHSRCGRDITNMASSNLAGKKRSSTGTTLHGKNTKQRQRDVDLHDIDSNDADDPQNVVDYIQDIYDYYREREVDTTVREPLSTSHQPHITERMRSILVDWILEVHYKFKLSQQTLHLSISVLDRFLAKSTDAVSRRELQLVGVTSLLLAAKYEELYVPELRDLAYICDGAYSETQILDTEERILNDIGYNLTVPTPHCFLIRYLKAARADRTIVFLASMILDSTLLTFAGLTCRYLPSQMAAASIFIARKTMGRPAWSPTLLHHTQYCEKDMKRIARAILNAKEEINPDLVALNKKYSKTKYGKVSDIEWASVDDEHH